jgi:hypothetical protein
MPASGLLSAILLDDTIGFWSDFKIGAPPTLITLALGL